MSQCRICLADHDGDYGAVLCEDCCLAGMHLFMQEALCAAPMPDGRNIGELFTSAIAASPMRALVLHMRERLLRCRAVGHETSSGTDCPRCGCSVRDQA